MMVNYVNLEKKFNKYTRNDVISILNRYNDEYYLIIKSIMIASRFLQNYDQYLQIDEDSPKILFINYFDQLFDYALLKNYVYSKNELYCSNNDDNNRLFKEVIELFNEQKRKEIFKLQKEKKKYKEINIDLDIENYLNQINSLYNNIINDYKENYSKTKKLGH